LNLKKEGLIDAYCTKGKKGEQYWHPGDKTWYWDRGVVVKRKATISGAPDAVVIVSGLARYHTDGTHYNFYKFLTTDNQYEGIPAPSKSELLEYVQNEIQKVFMGRAHNITEVSSIEMDPESSWIWHNANSFTVKFNINYKEIVSYTDVAARSGTFDIRFYRDSISNPVHNLMSTESNRMDIERIKYNAEEIRQMRTIASN